VKSSKLFLLGCVLRIGDISYHTLRTLLKQNAREDFGIHHIVVDDWNKGVDGEQNVVLISVPSVLSKDLAPPGKHVLHAYTPGTEPFSLWEGLDRKSADYRRLKEERSEVHKFQFSFLAML